MSTQGRPKSTDYAVMVGEAEASVSAVKDPELRRVAFEKILMTLLESNQPKSRAKSSERNLQRTASPAGKGEKHSGSAPRQGPKGYVEALIADGFFKEQRTIAEVKAELGNQGHHIALSSLSGPLQKLTQERQLRRQKATANGNGSKTTYAYSNW